MTPRRAGKTHNVIAYSLYCALLNPGATIPIITLTLKSAKKLYWEPFKFFNRKYGLHLEFRFSEQTLLLPNGSRIFLNGAETLKDVEKLRGGAYKLVLIDECKSFNIRVFEELIDEVLIPATNDVDGSIVIIGTPGSVLDGPFYTATVPGMKDEKGRLITRDVYDPEPFWDDPPADCLPEWSRHHWTVAENTFRPDIWERALAHKKRKRWANDNPIWLREYLGAWVAMSDIMVYALSTLIVEDGGVENCRALWYKPRKDEPGFNKWGLPHNEIGEDDWRYVMGMDMGFEDDFALVVMAYSESRSCLYHVYDFKSKHLTVSQIASVVKRVVDLFDGQIDAMVADTGGLGKMVVESLNQTYGFYIEAAEKTQKFDHIELLNSDLWDGKLKVLYDSCLVSEWLKLQWDMRGLTRKQAIRRGKLREDSSCDNHVADACLYTWRFSYHHFSRQVEKPAEVGSQEAIDEWDLAEYEAAIAERDNKQEIEEEWTTSMLMDDKFDTEWL